MSVERDEEVRALLELYRNDLRWRGRAEALMAILRMPLEALAVWELDWQRQAIANAEWHRVMEWYVPPENNVGRRAIGCCQRYRLSLADVQRADDYALLNLYGMGPKALRELRAIPATGEQRIAQHWPPLPDWVMEE